MSCPPPPQDTGALNTGVFPVSTPRTMFSQHRLPALPPPGGTAGRGLAIPAPECTARFNGPFSLGSCTLQNIKQLVVEVGGLFLLVGIPSGGVGVGGSCPHLQLSWIPPFRFPLALGEGQVSLLTHPGAARHLCRHHLTRPRMAGEGPHRWATPTACLCLLIKGVSASGGDTEASRAWSWV